MYEGAKPKTDLKPLESKVIGDCDKCKEKMQREQTTIRLPSELKEKLQKEANYLGISFNAYVLLLIDKGRLAEQE